MIARSVEAFDTLNEKGLKHEEEHPRQHRRGLAGIG
jgi:hypothetical protein